MMAATAPRTTLLTLLLVLAVTTPILTEAKRRCGDANAECTEEGELLCGSDWKSYRKCIDINGQLQPRTYQCADNEYFDPYQGQCVKIPGGGKTVLLKNKKKSNKLTIHEDPYNNKQYYAYTPVGVILLKCHDHYKFDEDALKCKKQKKPKKGDKEVYQLPVCTKAGKFPIPESKNLYYTCTGRPGAFYRTVHTCPVGTYFCPEQSDCIAAKFQGKEEDEDDASLYPPCVELGWFRVPKDCRRYYSCVARCSSGKLYQARYICPDGHAFCLDRKVCLPQELVPDCEASTEQILDIYPCSKPGKVPMPNLKGYYTCVPLPNGGYDKIFTHCPVGYVYCHTKQECVIAKPQVCDSKTTCTAPGWYADEKNCGFYYHCIPNECGGYNQTFYQCPKGEAFDQETGKCTAKALRECLYPSDTYLSGLSFICKTPGTFATNDCTGYCTCTLNQDGSWQKTCSKCAESERYSEELGICTSPENSKCIPISERPFQYDCQHAGIFPLETNENAYVICTKNINGTYTATLHHCPCGTYFNPSVGFCVRIDCLAIVETPPPTTPVPTTIP